jgi:hypothetical protein
LKEFFKDLRIKAKTVESAGNRAKGSWFFHLLLVKVASVIWSPLWSLKPECLQGRVVDIEAVDIVYGPAILLQKGCQSKEPEGLCPEVIGREVVNPWIDQEEIFILCICCSYHAETLLYISRPYSLR